LDLQQVNNFESVQHDTVDNFSPTNNERSEDQAGKLKLHEVRDLSDDVDEILGKLKPVDYGI